MLASYSDIYSDPRVRRQVDWLLGDGWSVDVLGLGSESPDGVRDTFTLSTPPKWVTSRLGYLATGALLPRRLYFRRQLLDQIPTLAKSRVKNGEYDLVVLNELEFLPWLADRTALGKAATETRIHLDLHEKHAYKRRRGTLGARLAAPYYRWQYRQIANSNISSRTVVNKPIGDLYADELGIPSPTPIRNMPPYEDLQPVDRGDGKIKLLFHGLANRERGLQEIVEAMGCLPSNFEATFMLMPNPEMHSWLQGLIDESPARDRIGIVPPAPMREIAERINSYDLEVIYFPHPGPNLLYALPNKFFESIQGRLGIITRSDGLMGPIVQEAGNGLTVDEHSGAALCGALKELTPEAVQEMKSASHLLARELNAQSEGTTFVNVATSGTLRL